VNELLHVLTEVSPKQVREKTYSSWQAAGCTCGSDFRFWLKTNADHAL
jgi:hypothetical protein